MRVAIGTAARELQVDWWTVGKWIEAGAPHTKTATGKVWVDVEELKAWRLAQNSLPGLNPTHSEHAQLDPDLKTALLEARLRKERAQAAKQEHALAVNRGDYLLKDEVAKQRLDRVNEVKAKLLAVPGKLASRLAHRSATEVYTELRREMLYLLSDFAKPDCLAEVPTDEAAVQEVPA